MPFTSKRAPLILSQEEKEKLIVISKSRTEAKSVVERANILLGYNKRETVSSIARKLHTNRPKVERCINKALHFGALTALHDLPRAGRPKRISREARAYLLSVACRKPKDLGFAQEFWTLSALTKYLKDNCIQAGYPSLQKISKGTVSKILSKSTIKPHKVSYYIEKRDPHFDVKMAQVLHVYKEIELYSSEDNKKDMVAILSYDEKPGIQAIGNVAADLPPIPGSYTNWRRDTHYKRYGTLSLLSSIDLLTGKVYGKVYERHRSREFIDFLRYIDSIYPEGVKIKIILDNHSSHISKETTSYLKKVPGRFEFIFTPTHASWLNLIEVFFSKMTRSFLRGIRVSSKDELKSRILQYLNEVNQMPAVLRWKWKMEEVSIAQ